MRTFDYFTLRERTWDSEILGLVAEIREHKGRQELYLKQKPMTLERLVEIAKIQSTESSNKIEGIITTSTRLQQLCLDKTMPMNRDEEEILGYRDVLEIIHENYEYISIESNYILQLHKNLYKYSERNIGGRYKNVNNSIIEKRNDGSEFIRFQPVSSFDTPNAIEAICDSFNKAIDANIIDALILIPTFINDFLCIHPFTDGNGRMSRILTTLLLYRCGYVVGRYISIESKIEQTKSKYYDVLLASGQGWHEAQEQPDAFIKYILGMILSAYRDFEERMSVLEEHPTSYDKVKYTITQRIGKFTKNEMMELIPSMGKTTVEKNIKRLLDEEFIERHGKGKNTYYTRKYNRKE